MKICIKYAKRYLLDNYNKNNESPHSIGLWGLVVYSDTRMILFFRYEPTSHEAPNIFQSEGESVGRFSPSPPFSPGNIPDCSAGCRIVIPFRVLHRIHPNTSNSTSLMPVRLKDSTPT